MFVHVGFVCSSFAHSMKIIQVPKMCTSAKIAAKQQSVGNEPKILILIPNYWPLGDIGAEKL
jgi:hypothetical protein